MSAPIESLLEEFLAGTLTPEDRRRFEAYLATNPALAREVAEMQELSTLFATLRPAGEIEPSARFYAGVMDKIEAQSRMVSAWWSSLLEPVFASRLVYATLTLLVVLGTAWVVLPDNDAPQGMMVAAIAPEAVISGEATPVGFEVKEENPAALLVNLASYEEGSSPAATTASLEFQ